MAESGELCPHPWLRPQIKQVFGPQQGDKELALAAGLGLSEAGMRREACFNNGWQRPRVLLTHSWCGEEGNIGGKGGGSSTGDGSGRPPRLGPARASVSQGGACSLGVTFLQRPLCSAHSEAPRWGTGWRHRDWLAGA